MNGWRFTLCRHQRPFSGRKGTVVIIIQSAGAYDDDHKKKERQKERKKRQKIETMAGNKALNQSPRTTYLEYSGPIPSSAPHIYRAN